MRRLGPAVAALCLVQFIDVLGVTVVVTALPSMLSDLSAPESSGSLVVTGYAMFFGGLLILGARLGDRFGHRRVIVIGLAVFALGSLVGALADTIAALTAARCVQGAAAATSVPSALRLLTTLTPAGPARRRAIAAWSAAGAAAGASGFVVGGIVTDLTSWRAIFWAYLPLSAVLAGAIVTSVPRDHAGERTGSLNVGGALTFTAAIMAVIVGTTLLGQAGHRLVGGGAVVLAGALAAVFRILERRAVHPLLPAAALSQPTLRRGAIGAFLNTATTSSAMTLATLYLQHARHRSPLVAAAALLPFSLAVVVGSALAAPVMRRLQPGRVLAVGLAIIALAIGALGATATSTAALSACVAVAGLGLGLAAVASTTLGTDVDTAWRSTASGIINTTAQLGTAIGTATLLLLAAATTGTTGHGTTGPVIAWAGAGVIALAGALGFARRADLHRISPA
jgi:MFS family permease